MKQITTTVYDYSELSDRAKSKARDWFRENLSFDGDTTIEDAKNAFAYAGFDIANVHFSGFSYQGDGACFTGRWDASKVDPKGMREYAGVDLELHRIADELAAIAARFPHAYLTVNQSGHYYHEYCTDFTITVQDDQGNELSEEALPPAEYAALEEALITLSRDAMRWIYRQLESEYDAEREDDEVAETIAANGYTFTEDGKRKG